MAVRFVIIGGGPAGNSAATHAARLGADVTVVERDVVGGAAHLWDCIPSKAMIATGGAMSFARRSELFGLQDETPPQLDAPAVKARLADIEQQLRRWQQIHELGQKTSKAVASLVCAVGLAVTRTAVEDD